MSDLQLGLLAIGAAVVIGVLAYNKWQEVRFRRQSEGHLKSRHDDVLMAEQSATAPGQGGQQQPGGAERVEPTFEVPPAPAADAPEPAGVPQLAESLDFIVTMEAPEDVDGETLLDAAAAPLAGFSRSVQLEGYCAEAGRWEPPGRGTRYSLLRAGLQLVDRSGPVSQEELVAFGAGVQQAAAAAGALATVPDRGAAMARAAELNEFYDEVDMTIGMLVVPAGAAFPGAKVRALAEAGGLSLERDGRFRRRDDRGRVLYELASLDAEPFSADAARPAAVSGLLLEMDVPRTPDPSGAYGQFTDLAHGLAQALGGTIVNENRAPIPAAAFDQILAQIRTVERAMVARSIAPGSPAAARLFS